MKKKFNVAKCGVIYGVFYAQRGGLSGPHKGRLFNDPDQAERYRSRIQSTIKKSSQVCKIATAV